MIGCFKLKWANHIRTRTNTIQKPLLHVTWTLTHRLWGSPIGVPGSAMHWSPTSRTRGVFNFLMLGAKWAMTPLLCLVFFAPRVVRPLPFSKGSLGFLFTVCYWLFPISTPVWVWLFWSFSLKLTHPADAGVHFLHIIPPRISLVLTWTHFQQHRHFISAGFWSRGVCAILALTLLTFFKVGAVQDLLIQGCHCMVEIVQHCG